MIKSFVFALSCGFFAGGLAIAGGSNQGVIVGSVGQFNLPIGAVPTSVKLESVEKGIVGTKWIYTNEICGTDSRINCGKEEVPDETKKGTRVLVSFTAPNAGETLDTDGVRIKTDFGTQELVFNVVASHADFKVDLGQTVAIDDSYVDYCERDTEGNKKDQSCEDTVVPGVKQVKRDVVTVTIK